jgi:hypothetical protein
MRRSSIGTAAALALALGASAPAVKADETRVALAPEPPRWHPARALSALRDGARGSRELRIETRPPDARLEIAYWRGGAQLARVSGAAPLVATLPGQALSEESDRVVVRAEREGYAPAEIALAARSVEAGVRLELARLPGALRGVALLELGPDSRLELLADRGLGVRLAATDTGWRLVLAGAAPSAEMGARIAALRGAVVERAALRSVGDDCIVELTRAPGSGVAPRLSRREEPVREVSRLALEWSRAAERAPSLAEARAALARLPSRACDAAFEDALVAELGSDALARSLAPSGAFPDGYVELALEAVAGRASDPALELRDGTLLRIDSPLARASAALRASEVRGVLVAIRALAETLAPAGSAAAALHAWLAPERDPKDFAARIARAVAAEARCAQRF